MKPTTRIFLFSCALMAVLLGAVAALHTPIEVVG